MIPNRAIDKNTEEGLLRLAVWEEANEWIDTPWVHHQMTKGLGCDCCGLVSGVGNYSNVLSFDWKMKSAQPFRGYSRNPDPKMMRRALGTFLARIPLPEVGIGDILWFRVFDEPQHVGILGPKRALIHADMRPKPKFPDGKVVKTSISTIDSMKLIDCFRYPGIDEIVNR